MKTSIAIFLTLVSTYGLAQQLYVSYRTAKENHERLHYLIFVDSASCKLIFPRATIDDLIPRKLEFDFKYAVINDTIVFYGATLDSTNSIVSRFLRSKCIITGGSRIFDTVSGYTYVDKELVPDEYFVFAYRGKVYKQRLASDGYDLALIIDQLNPRLKRKIRRRNQLNMKLVTVTGKNAYDKYGLRGMNGVIEIAEKK